MARRSWYRFQTDQGLASYPLAWCWAALRDEVACSGRPVACRAIARHLGWGWSLTLALLTQAEDLGLARRHRDRWAPSDVDLAQVLERYRTLAQPGPRTWTLEDLRRWGVTMDGQP